tara:strand:+ start:155 stop:709 length:555 start_codon:yes stop_codon:yes gene_type:complete
MDNYDNEAVEETTETPEVEEVETPLEEEVETPVVETEEEEEQQVDWEARAKKAEAAIIKAKSKPKAQKESKEVTPKTDSKLSIFDQKAIFNADIDTQEDLDEILDYADRKGVSVSDALNSTVIKATLAENAEIRKSAKAVNTGTGRRASGTLTDAQLASNAAQGKMPSSEEDIARLALARFQKK